MTEEKDTEHSITELLRKKFPTPEYALFTQVRNAATAAKIRTCDAMVMGLWQSRGIYLHGFEIKCARGDWLKELKTPDKAETFAPFCDFWWVVTSPDIVKEGEMPENWGWLERQGKKLVVRQKPARQEGLPMTRTMLSALCRRLIAPEEAAVNLAERRGYDEGVKSREDLVARYKAREEQLQKAVYDFERASGIQINTYSGGTELGDIVRRVRSGKLDTHQRNLEQLLTTSKRIAESIEREFHAFNEQQQEAATS